MNSLETLRDLAGTMAELQRMGTEGDRKTIPVDDTHRLVLTVKVRNAWGNRTLYIEAEYQEHAGEWKAIR